MSGRFFGKGCHLQERNFWWDRRPCCGYGTAGATMCSNAVLSSEMWSWVFRIQRTVGDVGGSLA